MAQPIIVQPPVALIHQKRGLCGAACAQMILYARGRTTTAVADQDQLWLDIQANTRNPRGNPAPGGGAASPCGGFVNQICEACEPKYCWCTHPTALASTLNVRLKAATYDVIVDASELGLTARALANVRRNIAPVVLVFGVKHWVVVRGYVDDPQRAGMTFDGQRVSDIFVHNPAWTAPRASMSASHWISYYMREILCGTYAEKWVMVGSSDGAKRPSRVSATSRTRGSRLPLEPLEVQQLARVEAVRLAHADVAWQSAFADAEPREPVLVRHLDDPGLDYYIVDFRASDGRPTGRMMFGVHIEGPGEVTGIDRPGASLPPLVSRQEALSLIANRQLTLPDGRLVPLVAAEFNAADLVWKPCDQSLTPFEPFYRLRIAGFVVYLRVDGELFTELTEFGAGA